MRRQTISESNQLPHRAGYPARANKNTFEQHSRKISMALCIQLLSVNDGLFLRWMNIASFGWRYEGALPSRTQTVWVEFSQMASFYLRSKEEFINWSISVRLIIDYIVIRSDRELAVRSCTLWTFSLYRWWRWEPDPMQNSASADTIMISRWIFNCFLRTITSQAKASGNAPLVERKGIVKSPISSIRSNWVLWYRPTNNGFNTSKSPISWTFFRNRANKKLCPSSSSWSKCEPQICS